MVLLLQTALTLKRKISVFLCLSSYFSLLSLLYSQKYPHQPRFLFLEKTSLSLSLFMPVPSPRLFNFSLVFLFHFYQISIHTWHYGRQVHSKVSKNIPYIFAQLLTLLVELYHNHNPHSHPWKSTVIRIIGILCNSRSFLISQFHDTQWGDQNPPKVLQKNRSHCFRTLVKSK